jgi:hypothetical protein
MQYWSRNYIFYVDVIHGKYCCKGMSNAYFVWYRYASKTWAVEEISKKQHPYLAFPSYYQEFHLFWSTCLSTEVWESSINIIQQAMTSLLCHYSQGQGTHPHGRCRVSLPATTMSYLSLWFSAHSVFSFNITISHMQKHVRSGFT